MAELGPDRIEDTLAACQASANEIAGAFGGAFAINCRLSFAVASKATLDGLSAEPGLLFAFKIGDGGAMAALGKSCGFLPNWVERPDAAGQSKLAALAVELGKLLFPQDCLPDSMHVSHVADLANVLRTAGIVDGQCQVTLTLADEAGQSGPLHLFWPAPRLDDARDLAVAAAPAATPKAPAAKAPPPAEIVGEHQLPSYSRSLLQIEVPLTVTLASMKQPVGRIVEIGPGSILQFDKAYDELLELEVGGHTIALGEAVKVGDKFGIRLSSLVLPDDRFVPLARRGT